MDKLYELEEKLEIFQGKFVEFGIMNTETGEKETSRVSVFRLVRPIIGYPKGKDSDFVFLLSHYNKNEDCVQAFNIPVIGDSIVLEGESLTCNKTLLPEHQKFYMEVSISIPEGVKNRAWD